MPNLLKMWIGTIALGGLLITVHINVLNTETEYDALIKETISAQKIEQVNEFFEAQSHLREAGYEGTDQPKYQQQWRPNEKRNLYTKTSFITP